MSSAENIVHKPMTFIDYSSRYDNNYGDNPGSSLLLLHQNISCGFTHWDHLNEAIPTSTYKINFRAKIAKSLLKFFLSGALHSIIQYSDNCQPIQYS